ncbi:MAG: hypothetical protein U1F76_00285 [Candidatus Competibacteraceae bacterium]
MGLMIFAGGCRYPAADGKTTTKQCKECHSFGACELEPQARALSELLSNQWISTAESSPPGGTAILYLEYPSELRTGTIHVGYYESDDRSYIEQSSGASLPDKAVIAWMPLPEVPAGIYKNRRFVRRRSNPLAAAKAID